MNISIYGANNKKSFTVCRKTLFIFCALMHVLSVYAEEQEPVDLYSLSLPELLKIKVDVVSRFSELPVEAAASVSHLDASEWQAFGAVRNSDAIGVLPGVMIYPSTGDFIAIRGYGQILSRRGIATLIDGVSVNDFAFGSSQVSMEHVSLGVLDSLDLIRGPGSVLYGTDAFHGTVSMNTYYREKADDAVRLSAGTEGESRGSWQFSQPFADGQYFNIALDKLNQHDSVHEHWYYGDDGKYFPGVTVNKDSRSEDTNLNTALLKWHNSHDDELFYQVSILHNQTDFSGFPGGGSVLGFVTEDTVGNDSRNNVYKFELERTLNPHWKLGGYGYYTDLNRDVDFQTSTLIGSTHSDVHKHGSQLYAKYLSTDETFRLFTGVEYGFQKIDDSYTRSFAENGTLQTIFPGLDNGLSRRVDSYLVQGRKDFSFIEIEIGARYDDYSDFGSQTTPRVALIKQLPDQQMVKLIYSESFRAAVSSEIEGSTFVRGDSGIKPETLDSYELVYSRQFEKMFVSGTLFKTRWTDGITVAPLIPAEPPFSSEYVNIADSESHGVELVLNYELGKWFFNTDLTYTHSKDTYRDIDYSAFPKYIWNTRINYNVDAANKLHITQRVRYDMTSGHNNYSEPNQQGENINTDLPAYWLVDLGFTHTFSPTLTGELVFKNVFDRDNWIPSVYNTPYGISEDQFSVLASLNLTF